MTHRFLLILIIAPIFLFTTCSEDDPWARFDTQYDVYEVGEEITFENRSLDATEYEWDFGDEYTSIRTNPVHIYEKEGIYTVTLTAYNNGNRDQVSKDLEITPPTRLLVRVLYKSNRQPASDCIVDVYASFEDYQIKNPNLAVATSKTDAFGDAFIYALSSQEYYIDVVKPSPDGGYWGNDESMYITNRIVTGSDNIFTTEIEYFAPQTKRHNNK